MKSNSRSIRWGVFFSLSILVLGLTGASARAAEALNWWDVYAGEYALTQTLKWSNHALPESTRVKFVSREGLAAVDVEWFQFRLLDCPDAAAETEMDIFLPEGSGTQRDHSVGAMIRPGCRLDIYVETADLMSPSFLSAMHLMGGR